ncbi:MAG: hypothetical protein NVS3B20_21840 [Polyangiales bacterium]
MNIAITFRHLDSSPAIKEYAHEKIGKLQRFVRSPMKASVILAVEKGEQMVEVKLNAGPEHYTAKETSENMYASIDRVCDKLEHQVQHAKGTKIAAKKGAMGAGEFALSSLGESDKE